MDIAPHLRCEIIESAIDRIARVDLVVFQAQDLDSCQGLGSIAAKHHVARILCAAFADGTNLPVDAFGAFIDVVDDLFAKLEFDTNAGRIIGDKLMDLTTVASVLCCAGQ